MIFFNGWQKKRSMDYILEDIDSWNKIQKNKYDYTGEYKNCRGCNAHVPRSWISRKICHLCDNYVQPYMTNPNNMKYVEKYFSKEIVELIKEKREDYWVANDEYMKKYFSKENVKLIKEKSTSILDIKKEDYWNANSINRLIINCDLDGIKFLVKKIGKEVVRKEDVKLAVCLDDIHVMRYFQDELGLSLNIRD